MWKALIKLVESWSYRCKHNYILESTNNILDREMYKEGKEVICRTEYIYRCTKCCDFKKLS